MQGTGKLKKQIKIECKYSCSKLLAKFIVHDLSYIEHNHVMDHPTFECVFEGCFRCPFEDHGRKEI